MSRLKEKWSEYWRSSREIKRHVSLFISPRGERVAVAAGNQITILQQDDDYKEPCGIFTSKIFLISLIKALKCWCQLAAFVKICRLNRIYEFVLEHN